MCTYVHDYTFRNANICVKYTPTIAHMDIFTYPHGPVNECTHDICHLHIYDVIHMCIYMPEGFRVVPNRNEGRKEGIYWDDPNRKLRLSYLQRLWFNSFVMFCIVLSQNKSGCQFSCAIPHLYEGCCQILSGEGGRVVREENTHWISLAIGVHL